jgi:hypothetical protein
MYSDPLWQHNPPDPMADERRRFIPAASSNQGAYEKVVTAQCIYSTIDVIAILLFWFGRFADNVALGLQDPGGNQQERGERKALVLLYISECAEPESITLTSQQGC